MRNKIFVLLTLVAAAGTGHADFDLLTAVQSSIHFDPQFLSTVQTDKQTMAAVGVAMANVLPQLSASNEIEWYNSRQLENGAEDKSSSRIGMLGFNVSQTIFNYSYYKNISSARSSATAAQLDIQSSYETLIQTVASAYFNVAKQQSIVGIDKEQEGLNKQLLNLARAKYTHGSALSTDVLTAKANLLSAKQQVITDNLSLVNYQNTLLQHLPQRIAKVKGINGVLAVKKPERYTLSKWVRQGLAASPAVLEQKLKMMAAKKTMQGEQAALLPNISATYGFNGSQASYAGQQYVVIQAEKQKSNTYTVSLNIPLYDGGSTIAQIKEDIYAYYAARETYRQQMMTTKTSVSTYYKSLILDADMIASLKNAVVAYKNNYTSMVKAYEAGQETMTDVHNALSSLYSEKSSLLQSQYQFLSDYINFKLNVGNLNINTIALINNRMLNHGAL